MLNRLFPDDIDVVEMFAGGGGSGTGIAAVPGTKIKFAANHAKPAKWTYVENHPNVDFWLGDVQQADAIEKFPYASFFWASPACFVAGTLVLTRRGLVPIEEVREGDEVFTHQRRWRPVTGTMSKLAPTVIVSGKGFHQGIETTAEHPFYTRKRTKTWDNDARTYRYSVAEESEWTEAKNLGPGTWWATPTDFGEPLPVPEVGGRGMEFTPEFWWMVGRWVGDGWLRAKRSTKLDPSPRRRSQPAGSPCVVCGGKPQQHGKSTTGRVRLFCSDRCRRASVRRNPHHGRYELAITCGYHEVEDLAQRLDALDELTWNRGRTKTAARFIASHRGLVEWMAEHFGQHAHGKTIPAWAMTMPRAWREALLDGYLSADGTTDAKYTRASTVSKKLAIGIRMLANSLGHVANLGYQPARKRQRVIDGRAVKERSTWTVSWVTAGPQRFQYAEAEGHRWSNTHHPASTRRLELVYNIHVADDESYVADGITVHNCPAFSTASGETRYFDKENQMALWADDLDNLTEHQKTRIRSRALMEEVVTYLRHCQEKHGKPVLGFGVENVVQARLWAHWDRWIRELRKLGYIIQIHAVNAAHVQGRTTLPTPQSRDRMLVSGIHESVGRVPNYRKWFDPYAYCPRHGGWVQAVRAWKKRGADMGVYGIKTGQYVWVCPEVACQGQLIEPPVLPAAYTIDWTDLGTPIGSRKKTKKKPEGLAPKTIARIRAGVEEHWIKPFITPAGGTWNDGPRGVDEPIPALTTREANALVVPCEGRDGKMARPVSLLKRTSTTRNEDGIAFPPDAQPGVFPSFLTLLRSDRARNTNPTTDPLATLVSDGANGALATDPDFQDGMLPLMFPFRGGGDEFKSRPAFKDPAHAVTAGGFHHGLGVPPGWEPPPSLLMRNNGSRGDGREHVTPTSEHMRTVTTTGHQSLVTAPLGLPMPETLLMAYYGNGRTQSVHEPVGTIPTRDRMALLTSDGQIDVSSILFRMLRIHELRRAQSFPDHYQFVADSARDKVKLIGNAVPPPMAEILTCALIEAFLGIELSRFDYGLAA